MYACSVEIHKFIKKFILYFVYLTYHTFIKKMIKEYKINDILSAVDSISKMKGKKDKDIQVKNDILPLNNQVKSNKSEILVLDEMIE